MDAKKESGELKNILVQIPLYEYILKKKRKTL